MSKEKIKWINCQLLVWSWEHHVLNLNPTTDYKYDMLLKDYNEALKTTDYRPYCSMHEEVICPTEPAYLFANAFIKTHNPDGAIRKGVSHE